MNSKVANYSMLDRSNTLQTSINIQINCHEKDQYVNKKFNEYIN